MTVDVFHIPETVEVQRDRMKREWRTEVNSRAQLFRTRPRMPSSPGALFGLYLVSWRWTSWSVRRVS